MITNERQYRITKNEIRKFEQALAALMEQGIDQDTNEALARSIQVDAMRSQLADLRADIADFDALRSGQRRVIGLDSFDQLPQALIAARISSGMTQGDLAERLGIHEQQVQRYEATNYAAASIQRVKDVVKTLGVGIREEVLLPVPSASPRSLFARLDEAGLEKTFVTQRILSPSLRAELEQADHQEGIQAHLAMQAAAAVDRIYDLGPSAIFGIAPLVLNGEVAGAARFNVRVNANERRLVAYAVYARYLAEIIVAATPDLQPHRIPPDPREFHAQVVDAYGAFDFDRVLRFAWDMGVAVLPLNDPGTFHGACWRIRGRNVVVLKQRTRSSSRWLENLLHELCHAAQDPKREELAIIDEGETLRERKESQEERRAVRFAASAALNGREEELTRRCYEAAGYRVERLTTVVPRIAAEEGVDVGVLADYLAFRLTFEQPPVDWWGAATNLQPTDADVRKAARALLVRKIDLSQVDQFDRELLMRALSEPEV